MASNPEFVDFVIDQIEKAGEITLSSGRKRISKCAIKAVITPSVFCFFLTFKALISLE